MCRVIWRRAEELGLTSLADYRDYLEENPYEWERLDAMVDVTISRFCRDRAVFDFVLSEVFPCLVKRAQESGDPTIRVWSSGCANGEEPYTISIMWELEVAPTAGVTQLQILATDIKEAVLHRARDARYPRSALRDLPQSWREAAFSKDGEEWLLQSEYRDNVTFAQHDVRDMRNSNASEFDLILCRYQAFTYFDDAGQRDVLRALSQVTRPGAVLVLGQRENLPPGEVGFGALSERLGVFQRST